MATIGNVLKKKPRIERRGDLNVFTTETIYLIQLLAYQYFSRL